MKRLVLRSFQSPGDIVMLTAAVRDLHAAYPGQFQTDVRTSANALWENNPHLTRLNERDAGVHVMDMHYPLIHQSNQRPYHFLHGYAQFLEQQLDLRIPVTRFAGDIHLSNDERSLVPLREHGVPDRFWIIVAGGKYDFTAKWWNPDSFQAVVDHFKGRIQFVQCGEAGHWHSPLNGVVSLIGKSTLRDFVRLVHFAEGIVCPVTLAMHLSAAVPSRGNGMATRPCVVVAGGREPAHWEAYPNHQFISTSGALSCCANGGCWKSRCQTVGDGDPKDSRDLCERPVQVRSDLRIPKCMDMITPADVIRRVELYFEGGVLANGNGHQTSGVHMETITADLPAPTNPTVRVNKSVRVAFHHGLGDCAYFAHLIPLYLKRGIGIEVQCTPDKRILFQAAGAKIIEHGTSETHHWGYPGGGTYEGHGRFWQGSKMGHNISQAPLPNIGEKETLWDEYCQTRVDIEPHLPEEATATVRRWIGKLPKPVVLLHTKGNTGQQRKSLPDDITSRFYQAFLDTCDGSLILLDWDKRVPRLASYRVRHLDDLGSCPTEVLLALMCQADLLVGVDSGPLHVARFTQIPTLGVWMPGHYPSTYTLPRREQLNVVLAEETRNWNKFKRIPWNIVEHPGRTFDPCRLAENCRQLLSPPRYLSKNELAADVQLQQFIRQWCRGQRGNALSSYCDRNRSFDVLFQTMSQRFQDPIVVETGTIRAEEDWPGAGFFTYLCGAYLYRRGGKLFSVDITPQHCQFATDWTRVFGDTVSVVQKDSIAFLREFKSRIDVLYLDSLDTTEPGHAEHASRELEAALPKLHDQSVVVVDDTPWRGGAWVGKGARAVPELLAAGWRVLYAGYQVVLSRNDSR